jgi:hypothetical protein
MNPSAFDTLVRLFAPTGTRRRLLAGVPLLGALAVVGEDAAAAERPLDRVQRRTRRRNRKQRNNKDTHTNNGGGDGGGGWGQRGGTERDLHLLSRQAGLLSEGQRLLLARAGGRRRGLLSPRQHLQQQSGATGLLLAPLPERRLLSVRQCRQLPAVCGRCGTEPSAGELPDILPRGAGLHAGRMPSRVMHA